MQALKFLHQNLSSSKYLLTKLFWNDVQKTATGTWWYWHGLISLIGIFLSVLRLCPGNVIWFKLFILNLSYTTSTKIGVFKPVAQRGCNRTDQLRAKDQELFHRSNWFHFAGYFYKQLLLQNDSIVTSIGLTASGVGCFFSWSA